MKLIQWWLVHRVPIDVVITPEIEAAGCRRFKIPWENWEEGKNRFPRLLPKVNEKRLRRVEYGASNRDASSCRLPSRSTQTGCPNDYLTPELSTRNSEGQLWKF
jgi:hypothetical protein